MTQGRRLLFADDDPGVQRAVKRLAEKNGFELLQVLAGSGVYEVALADAPDLIVLDLGLPDLAGASVCAEMAVRRMDSTVGTTTGPPAESEYAVEPVGVAITIPSAA